MPFRHLRQLPSGDVTLSVSTGSSNSLDIDSTLSGTISGIAVPTLTISSTAPPTTITESASSTPTSTSAGASTSKISIGTIIGLIVGIFAILAVALVAFMTIRHKKTLKRARAKSMARKSWSRLKDEKPTELQMRATSHADTASIADAKTRMDDSSSLVPSPPAHPTHPETALPSRNPNFIAQGLSKRNSGAFAPPPSRSVDESHIPNPFASPTVTPTHSPSPSHASTHSSDAQHSLALAALSSFSQHTPQYTHASMITASSASEYPPEQSSFRANPSDAVKHDIPTQSRLSRKQSAKVAEESRSRELKAMQDLISALDERAQEKRAPPTAFNLNVDTNSSSGKSRLSLGEGLVTPGGHSIRDEDAA